MIMATVRELPFISQISHYLILISGSRLLISGWQFIRSFSSQIQHRGSCSRPISNVINIETTHSQRVALNVWVGSCSCQKLTLPSLSRSWQQQYLVNRQQLKRDQDYRCYLFHSMDTSRQQHSRLDFTLTPNLSRVQYVQHIPRQFIEPSFRKQSIPIMISGRRHNHPRHCTIRHPIYIGWRGVDLLHSVSFSRH